ncbi:MAG: nucleotidyltransferase domain-containing protein [Candidatus Woesearchaeota archaeon]
MKSKEEKVLELFFQEPTREWHFEEILKESDIARSKADAWLKKFIKGKLVKRVKKKGSMPHYISDYDSSAYKNRKRLFAQQKLFESGLLDRLLSLPKAKTVVIFGSMARSDWYKKSDIDIFIYGEAEGLKIADFELGLQRDIQLFICRDKKDLKKLGSGFIKNIIRGNLIKGNLDFIRVDANA